MSIKIGRNDVCSCGSGEKYKKCCLSKTAIPRFSFEEVDKEWSELRRLEGSVIDKHLIPYAMEELPEAILGCALVDFFPEDLSEEVDREMFFHQFFLPWFFFNWLPLEDFGVKQFDDELTLSSNYLQFYGTRLNNQEKRFLEAMNQTYYSFYCVLEVELNQAIVMKDILLGTTHRIKERQGTHQLKKGDVVFTRVVTVNNQSIAVGMSPLVIPVDYHNDIIDFKRWLIKEKNEGKALSAENLRNQFDIDLLHYYFDIIHSIYNRPAPTLVNTEGDLLAFTSSHFKLMISPVEALDYLLSMTLEKNAEPFLEEAKKDKSGKIKQIEIPWLMKGNKKHAHWENTVLGHIRLEKGKLILDTNSEKRAKRGKKLLIKYLGEAILFEKMIVQSPKEAEKAWEKRENQESLLPSSEAQEQIKWMVKAHWESWFDQIVPALDHQTPREAAKTKDGREKLEALLLQYERQDLERKDQLLKADIKYLRAELALD